MNTDVVDYSATLRSKKLILYELNNRSFEEVINDYSN